MPKAFFNRVHKQKHKDKNILQKKQKHIEGEHTEWHSKQTNKWIWFIRKTKIETAQIFSLV